MDYKQTGPTFAFCGTFCGTKGVAASKWLKKFEHEMAGYKNNPGTIPPKLYLDSLDMLLTDDANDWAESHPEASRLLALDEPDQAAVDSFKSLICEKFPSKAIEVAAIPFDVEISELRQRSDEALSAYYKRVCNLMQRVGTRDRSTATHSTLTVLESTMLDTILRAFVRGLSDNNIRKEATRGMAATDRSLKSIYNLAEEARRSNLEVQKLFEEEFKHDELEFYKSLAQKNLQKHQIEALLTSYHATKASHAVATPSHQPWAIHEDTRSQAQDKPGSQPPSYRYETPVSQQPSYQIQQSRPLQQQSSSRQNQNANDRLRPKHEAPQPHDLPDRSTSKNPWINGTLTWSFDKDGRLCVKCGTKGHNSIDCKNTSLPSWERSYLRMIVFGDNPQTNFASANYGAYDGQLRAYGVSAEGHVDRSQSSSSTPLLTPSSSSIDSFVDPSPRVQSLAFGVAGLSLKRASSDTNVHAAEAYYGEGSAAGKRPAVEIEDEAEITQQPPQRPKTSHTGLPQPLPYQRPEVPQQPFVAPFLPQQAQQPFIPDRSEPKLPQQPQQGQQQPYQFQAVPEDRRKRKGQKRVGKKVELQPVVGLFNESIGGFDAPLSVRQLLQTNKVDITWMDLVAWSPAMCKELKRLCTRVTKKRASKSKFPQTPQLPQPIHFQQFQQPGPVMPTFMPQFQQSVRQVPQPTQAQQQSSYPSQTGMGQQPQQPQSSQQSTGTVSQVTAASSRHTQFLSKMLGVDKAFRIPCSVKKADATIVDLEKHYVQADQGSDMNVISEGLVNQVGLARQPLAEVGFAGLSMRTADHRDTLLHHWVKLTVGVQGIWRDIRCFVTPKVTNTSSSGETEYLSLILGIPWLYSVDALISVRQSKIMVGDVSIGEQVREVAGPELVFCSDHNLLMYPKSVVAVSTKARQPQHARVEEVDEDEESSDSSESSDSGDELSDINEDVVQQGFR